MEIQELEELTEQEMVEVEGGVRPKLISEKMRSQIRGLI